MAASSCATQGAPELRWTPKLYATDSGSQSIVRRESGRVIQIKCAQSSFNGKVCMDKSEIANATNEFHRIINQCDRWKSSEAYDEASELVLFFQLWSMGVTN